MADIDSDKLQKCKKELNILSIHKVDVKKKPILIKLLRNFDVIVGALPPDFGFEMMKTAIEAGTDVVDISFVPENPLKLDSLARKKKVKVVPDCGVAPGISNMLIGHAISELKKVNEVYIKVGGLPVKHGPPLDYKIVFSFETVIEEYTRRVTIVKDGKLKEVKPLSGLEELDFKGFGKLECFYTDGLRTLIHTIKGVKEMDEKTIRYPSHTVKIRTLLDCGFFDTDFIEFKGMKIKPRDFSLKLLAPKLALGKEKDFTLLRVDVKGEKHLRYELIDYYRAGVTSMARTTGYPCAIVARMMKKIKGIGVIPPEKLGMDNVIFSEILKQLRKRNITIRQITF